MIRFDAKQTTSVPYQVSCEIKQVDTIYIRNRTMTMCKETEKGSTVKETKKRCDNYMLV